MDFIDIQRKLVDVLLSRQVVTSFSGRTSLLHGLPDVALNRAEGEARLDLNNIVNGLHRLGRLTKSGGVRPVIVVVDNALATVPASSEAADELLVIRALLEAHYGGDVQPAPERPIGDAAFEALVFGAQRDARLDFAFIRHAHDIARSIARLTVHKIVRGARSGDVFYGTGWIIASGLLMTNHHVIDARDRRPPPEGAGDQHADPADLAAQAESVTVRFDYYNEAGDSCFECHGSKLIASSRELDYAVIELEQAESIADRRPIRLVSEQPTLGPGSRVNIVQHPRGGPLRFAIRNNFFVPSVEESAFMLYQTDTEAGASGAPVCGDDWRVVALHHAARAVPSQMVPQEVLGGKPAAVTVLNEAIHIHRILDDLPLELQGRILAHSGE